MLVNILLLILGFVILIKAADVFVDHASEVALHFNVSKMVIGLTIVAFGTSAPEFAVSVQSLLNDSSEMLLGNVIGSNIINILLIVGCCSLIVPIKVKSSTVSKEIPICLLLTTLLTVLFLDVWIDGAAENSITRSDGVVIVLVFMVFIYYLFRMIRNKTEENDKPTGSLVKSIIFIVLGITAIVLSSDLVVNQAIMIATKLNISDRVISLTVIALGTSLPELVTSITAARKKELDILVGNIIGSNIFNICIVLGLPVAIFGTVTPASFQILDFIVVLVATIFLYIFSRRRHQIDWYEGAFMLGIFVSYYLYILLF